MAETNGSNGNGTRALPAWLGLVGATVTLVAFVWVMAFNPINVKFEDLQKQIDRRFDDIRAHSTERFAQHEKADDTEAASRAKVDKAINAKIDELQRQLIDRFQLFPTQQEFKASMQSVQRDAERMNNHHVGRDEYNTAMQALISRLESLQHAIDDLRSATRGSSHQ